MPDLDMAQSKVVIAYFNETWWLVQGEVHLHDMLAAKESPELEIEIITCTVWSQVMQLWDDPEFGKMPWAINPKIIDRIKTRERTTVT